MTVIESKKVQLTCNPETAFNYVKDLNNFSELLPLDRITDFKASSEECSFKAQGSFHIGLKKDTETPNSKVILVATDKSAIKFNLEVFIDENEEGCEVYQICNAELNPFLKMMVEKPLNNLFDFIADRMQKVHG